ncbi:hypothetical protein ILUMI_14991, partial [Ignelater luminosus]
MEVGKKNVTTKQQQKACDGSSSQQTKITISDEEIEEIILSTLENAKKDCEQLGISVIENSWNTLILLKSVSTTEIDEELKDGRMYVLGEKCFPPIPVGSFVVIAVSEVDRDKIDAKNIL